MLHHLEKLRKHPEHVRERIALLVAGLITLFIFVGWAATLDTQLALGDFGLENTAAAGAHSGLIVANEAAPLADSPTAILKKQFGRAYGELKEAAGR